MNIITCLVLNMLYNVSQVIFGHLVDNARAGSGKYIMYPRFIQMMIDDLVKDIPKDDDDVLCLRNMMADTISRLAKGPDQRAKRMICRIDNPAYVAPENDAWRHENSNSKSEDNKMNEMIEKKLRYWFVKDGKRKRTPKTSPVVSIPNEPTPKIVVKGPSKETQLSLIDEPVVDPADISQQGIDLTNATFKQYIKITEEITQKDQSTSVQTESVKEPEPEGVARDDSSEADDESTETETGIDLTTLGRGKTQLKKKPLKKRKGSDEEDTTYTPNVEEKKTLRIKRKAVQSGVIPRNVRAKKGGATLKLLKSQKFKDQGGKSEKHVTTSKGLEAEKVQSIETTKEPEVQSVEIPVVEVQKKAGDGDDEVEITGVRASTPPPPPPPENVEIPESSQPKNTVLPGMFEGFPNIRGELKDDFILGDEFDMFHDAQVNALEKKVSLLEKEKAKAEADRDELKMQLVELKKVNEEIKSLMIKQAKKLKNMKDDVEDNAKLFDILQQEISELHMKNVKLNDINKSLNQLISELHEASANEFKAMKLKMEAMKADNAMKDEQLTMLYTVMESHLGIDVHSVYNNIEIKKAEERRVERERRLAEEATQRKKSVIVETQEAGGSSSQADVEMVDVEVDQAQGFVLIGKATSLSYDFDDIIRRVQVEQRRRLAKEPEMMLLKWKDEEIVEEEEDEEEKIHDDLFEYIDNYPEENEDDDNDQGSSSLLIVNPSVQQRIEDFMNDEINEQEEDQHQESSSSGKQHADQVFLTQPTVIYLHAKFEGEIEVPRSRAEMLEELGLDDGKFKFDIEDEIPSSPEWEYEFKYAQEADKYNEVLVEDASDSSDEETNFHYSGVDETFPSLAEMFKDQNEDEIRRKIVEKITTEGVPRTIPRENLAEERKKWLKVMPKERKFIRPLQYFTHGGMLISW
ncbi:hypothetical protein HanXRQr2_Chr10g0451661 [Helianthus annuus]|uniref:Uncharacterized protein n=1 Tax=Helianthus annuus TaxID=4232 RepID=A0A9K3N5L8_HELAN|nr:hypothetical protein HanXRQr2_Chr10g0451661 [Helianthus annuus]KAJ0514614.1 hypothetical protein HanHA300_Chr10g0371421 [Helianthus annuus]KAJ0522836.1 hypothetical protein HanIR_Chr10g0486971 [Helianthus annuus]